MSEGKGLCRQIEKHRVCPKKDQLGRTGLLVGMGMEARVNLGFPTGQLSAFQEMKRIRVTCPYALPLACLCPAAEVHRGSLLTTLPLGEEASFPPSLCVQPIQAP